ncbi:MAG: hypothetical protein ACHP65_06860, partial [Legionellales bacterium]
MSNFAFTNELYNEIFIIQTLESALIVAEEPKGRERIEKKLVEIRARYAVIPELERLAFRGFLRDINSTNLELILYGNNTDAIPAVPQKKAMPSDADIKGVFNKTNDTYQYFQSTEAERQAFIKFFKLCKVTADYIEC